jgi:hypothetical protein
MARIKVRTKFDKRKLVKKAKEGSFRSLGHAAASIRLAARGSIRRSKNPSAPGRPPHTRTGVLKRSIIYAIENKDAAYIGPAETEGWGAIAQIGEIHEFGGTNKRYIAKKRAKFLGRMGEKKSMAIKRYPKRPFMRPALEKRKDRIPRHWKNSIR